MDRTDQTLGRPYIKKHFGWKLAFLQHPMYLLIDEDRGEPIVGERVGPWGAPDADVYVERVRRNLDSMERYGDLRLNYEFSAVELESMCRRFPDVYAKMKALFDKRSLDIVDGTYSQAHLQVYGSESTWRQFAEGLRVIRELFGRDVEVYATQETGLHQQIPQILRKLGYEFLVVPAWPWSMELLEGRWEITGMWDGMQVQNGDDFVQGAALDGTEIPMYMRVNDVSFTNLIRGELNKDLYAGPPVHISIPDMEEFNEDEYNKWSRNFEFCLLGEALAKRYEEVGSRAKARIYTQWSYIEGVWAEQLLRENKLSEEMGVLADGINAMATYLGAAQADPAKIQALWLALLKYQHHDVYWIEVTDLRRQAIERYRADRTEMQAHLKKIASGFVLSGDKAVFINTMPYERTTFVISEAEVAAFQKHGNEVFGTVTLPAGGYRAFAKGMPVLSVEGPVPKKIITNHYSVAFSKEGLISQIYSGETALLNTGDYLGGELRALINNQTVSSRTCESMRFFEGPQAYILERDTRLGHISVNEQYHFLRGMNAIRVRLTFDFAGDEVGLFYLDESKINIYYPTIGGEITHDVPFGWVVGKEKHVLFATNWIKTGGLCYVNRGTCKCWVRNGVIANVLAWGGDEFTNRMHTEWTERTQYDLRLYGKQEITYYLIPDANASANDTVRAVDELAFPALETEGSGEASIYRMDGQVHITDVYSKEGAVYARGYQLPGEFGARFRDFEIFNCKIDM